MEIKNKNNKEEFVKHNSLETKAWHRFAKVIYIVLWIAGLGISAIVGSVDGFSYFIWGSIITCIILTGVKKAFLYVIFGKNK
ncbi:MAG: hypothetical protein PHV29_03505 [Candidatus Pacebacteria bacterium]|nr:hypothetical protein [Candidatus Paceibacterota bacterium]